MKKETPYLDLYKEWMREEKIPNTGLCWSVPKRIKKNIFKYIKPTPEDIKMLNKQNISSTWWGYGIPRRNETFNTRLCKFTPLRQNLILLCAALNDEL